MKKIIIMSLFATLLSVFTASAQENTYSMVIKMQDGTVFTIGPNEADSIFFDEGKLTVTGQSVTDIMKRIDKDSLLMDGFYQSTNMNMNVLQQQISIILEVLSDQQERVKVIPYLSEDVIKLYSITAENQNDINKNNYNIYALQNENAMLKENIDELKAKSYDQEAQIAVLTKDNATLKAKIAQLETAINELMNR